MSEICSGNSAEGTFLSNDGQGAGRCRAARHLTNGLRLAASPTFAIMALVAGLPGGGQSDLLCSAAEHASPLSGMAPMYLLMSAFHSPPWLTLFSRRGLRAP